MTSNVFCWQNTKTYVITLAIPLITIIFGARADVINQTEFSFPVQTERTNFTSSKTPATICHAAYTKCENGYLCLKYWNISNGCHPGYTNASIIKKCQDIRYADFINDTALFTPLTNTEKNITYFNVYCSICNFEKHFFELDSWTTWLFFRNNESEFIRSVSNTKLMDKLKVDNDYDDSNFIGVFNETNYKCNVLQVVPDHLKNYVEHCTFFLDEMNLRTAGVVRAIGNSFSHILNKNYLYPDRLKFFLLENSPVNSYCDYTDKFDDTCSINKFLSNFSFTCGKDGFILWNSSKDGNVLAQCSNHTSTENYFYVCGPSKSNLYEKIRNRLFNILDHISIFLLFLYLVLSCSKQNLKSLPKRIFYSYSVTLFAINVLQFPLKYVKSCVMKYYLFSYTWQSHSFWILITSFDLWRLVYNSSKFQKVHVERQTKRYVIYCMLGWGLPALLLAALFPTFTQDQKSWSCPSVVGFENEIVCSSSYDLNKYTVNFGWVTIIIFLLLTPAFLIMTCVLVFQSMKNRARSNVNRYYTTVLLKVAIMMGLHWTLLFYLTLFDSGKKFSVIYRFMSSFHGSFIFFAFGFKENLDRFKRVIISRSETEEIQFMSSESNQNTRSLSKRTEQSVEGE